jgi:YihY family inner membrane protein
VSLFPLLLVATTVLGYVLHDNPDLQQRILDSALANFPIIGDQLRTNVTSVRGTGVALVVGILFTLYGGLGIANVSQQALNRIWGVPIYARPGFFPRLTRSLALIAMLGLAILVTTVLSGIGARVAPDLVTSIGVALVAITANIVLFAIAFQVMIARPVAWRDLMPGAIVAGVLWELMQRLGSLYVSRVLQGMSQVYGLFALVLGLLVWISLQARVVLYSAEINAVKVTALWPRSIGPPLTEADRRADVSYVRIAERHQDEAT